MRWNCPHDHAPLQAEPAGLGCPDCARTYAAPDGIALFAPPRETAELSALWSDAERAGADAALARYGAAHGCARPPLAADWKFFFPVRAGATVLELGAGAGDDTVELAAAGARVAALVPSLANARLVARVLRERGAPDCALAVATSLERLPVACGAVDALALEAAALRAFDVSAANFERIAVEWARVLAPGGTAFLGLANPLHRLPGVRRVRRWLGSRPRPEALNRRVKRAAGGAPPLALGVAAATRALRRAGFAAPAIHAPLPDEDDPRAVIPLHDPQAVRYFLRHLIRRNSPLVRAAVGTAGLLASLGLLRRLVPYYYLVFRMPERR